MTARPPTSADTTTHTSHFCDGTDIGDTNEAWVFIDPSCSGGDFKAGSPSPSPFPSPSLPLPFPFPFQSPETNRNGRSCIQVNPDPIGPTFFLAGEGYQCRASWSGLVTTFFVFLITFASKRTPASCFLLTGPHSAVNSSLPNPTN
jgi:hypothetical protein